MDLDSLTPLFEMDDYSSCLKSTGNQYCSIEAKLDFSLQNDSIKTMIKQNFVENLQTLDRSVIRRALCLPKSASKNSSLYDYAGKIINDRLRHSKLSALVDDATCTDNGSKVSSYDHFIMIFLMFYVTLVLFATYYDLITKKGNSKELQQFSIIYLWRRKVTQPLNLDYQKLLSMQGLRLFTLLALIYSHVMFRYNVSYISNPINLEKMYEAPEAKFFATFTLFLVLIFFLFSSWLMTVQVYNIQEKNKDLSLKDVLIMILNRYFRFVVTLSFTIIISNSSIIRKIMGPTNFSVLIYNENACRKSWIHSIFFISNFQYIFNICNPVSWYLSADFQLYLVNLFLLYIKIKYKLRQSRFCVFFFLLALLLHGLSLYWFEVDIMFRANLRNLELRNYKNSTKYLVSYMSTLSIWPSSLVGVYIGELYHKNKNAVYNNSWKTTLIWVIIFYCFPGVGVLLCFLQPKPLLASIIGAFVKPIFTFGIGLGVLGMSHNFGGIVKRILENKLVVLMSNFTFCVYLIHTGVINTLHNSSNEPLRITDWLVVSDYLSTIFISFVLGVLVSLLIEEPGLNLQKKLLPQLSKWVPKSKD